MRVLNIQFKYIIIFYKSRYIIFHQACSQNYFFKSQNSPTCKSFKQNSLALAGNCLNDKIQLSRPEFL